MTKTINTNTLARKALPIIRARALANAIGGIIKTTTKSDNRRAPMNEKYIINMVEEAINLSHKVAWTFAQRLNGR